jgi:hypothetical protein
MLSLRTQSKTMMHTLATAILFAITAAAQTAPTIVGLSPSIAAPGSSTIITGGSFIGTSQVTFGGHKAVFQVDSATQISAIVPLAATTGLIEVTTPSGTATSSQSFEVIAETWDAVKNFSTASNPNSAWSYGWASSFGGTFSLLTSNEDCPQTGLECWQNGLQYPDAAQLSKNTTPNSLLFMSVVVPPNTIWLGAQANAVMARWTAPFTGNYTIVGSFQANDTYEQTVKVGILKNDSTFLLTDSFSAFGEVKDFALSNVPLTAGTTIDFELAYTTSAGSDNVTLIATINLLR